MGPSGKGESPDSTKQSRLLRSSVRTHDIPRQHRTNPETRTRRKTRSAAQGGAANGSPRQEKYSIQPGTSIPSPSILPSPVGPKGPDHPSENRLAPFLPLRPEPSNAPTWAPLRPLPPSCLDPPAVQRRASPTSVAQIAGVGPILPTQYHAEALITIPRA